MNKNVGTSPNIKKVSKIRKYNGAFYWHDTETDLLYCYETENKVGRKIDNYQAEFY